MTLPLYLTAELRALEGAALAGLPAGTLMERAGTRIAEWVARLAAPTPGSIVFLAGPGNNGGDALTAAALLSQQGFAVEVVLLQKEARYRGDAALAWQRWQECTGGALAPFAIEHASIVVDGLFGIGLNKPVPAEAADWIKTLNEWQARTRRPVLAIDIPSGLSADTGTVNGCAVRATHTLSFLGAKPGLYTGDGPDYCGTVVIEALGTAPAKSSGILVAPEDFALAARPRAKNSNKGQFGNLGVLAGAQGMVGAGLLCSRTALYAGAGRVYVQLPGNDAPAVDWLHPELMFRSDLGGIKLTAAVAGPGLGEPPAARSALENLIDAPIALVLDADALNAIAKDPSLTARVKERSAPKILTPHPLEAARLLHADVARVERDRIGAALELARSLDAHVVVKGAGSVLARPDGAWAINPTGNPALASAGTGDVLSGLLGGLLAQGWDIWSALMGAVWIHGRAADQLVLTGHGPVGLTASELMPAIRLEINRLVSAH